MTPKMFEKPSLMLRIVIGKAIGFLFGLAGFILLPQLQADASGFLRWGILFWYPTVGAFIGVFGVVTYHPLLRLPMPWWFRSTLIGAWMNFVLILFTYDTMAGLMLSLVGETGAFASPFWLVAEGAAIGLVIGYFATRFGGEGRETVAR